MTRHEQTAQPAQDAAREMMAQARPDQIRRLLDDIAAADRGHDRPAGGSA
jgi:hypothetical protein